MKATAKRWTIVVVGQSPKLASGQAKMIGYLLDYTFEEHELIHVPMNFSGRLAEMGRPGLRKAIHLCEIIMKLWWIAILLRFRQAQRLRPLFPPCRPTPDACLEGPGPLRCKPLSLRANGVSLSCCWNRRISRETSSGTKALLSLNIQITGSCNCYCEVGPYRWLCAGRQSECRGA